MNFVSELTGKKVVDVDGELLGVLDDVIATPGEIIHPMVVAILVKKGHHQVFVPIQHVMVLTAPVIPLNCRRENMVSFQPTERDLFLVRDVLDKQIIDTNGIRVVRVNDLELARVNDALFVANVDIGSLGLLRRLGLARAAQRVVRQFHIDLPANIISWDHVELVTEDQPMRLRVPGEKITDLHPADLAEILGDLNRNQSAALLEQFDVKTLADTLEEVETDFQVSIVENLSDEKVADVLEEMAPDEAADLLAELPKDRSEDLLDLMEDEGAEEVRKLLTYPEDSAGGIMTTEYIEVRPDLTAEEAIAYLRENAGEAETFFYVYVVSEENDLVGVFSLSDLVLAHPTTPVTQFMHKRIVTVDLVDSQEDVAQVIAKYNLLAVPVIDENRKLHGIVTADDALDKIIPTAWKKRLPRMYR